MKLRDIGDASIIYVGNIKESLEIGGIVVLIDDSQPDFFNQINAKIKKIDGENYEGEIIVHTIDPDILPIAKKSKIQFKKKNIIVYK